MNVRELWIPAVVLLAALGWTTAPVQAAIQLPPFEELDQDEDGAISKDEASVEPDLVAQFEKGDSDEDGELSEEEYNVLATGGKLKPEEGE
jgi:hypothetical protein